MADAAETIVARRKVLKDPASGREVWQVTPDGTPFTKGYMYLKHFSPDERCLFLLGVGDGRSGIYCLEIETGAIRRLAALPGPNGFQWNAHPFDPEVYFYRDGRVMAVRIETGEERLVLDPRRHESIHGNAGGPIMFSGSGRRFSLSFVHDPQECLSPPGWSHWGVVKYVRCGAARAACDGGGPEPLYLHFEAMQHLMFCPAGDDLLTFAVWPDYQNNTGLMSNLRARAWLVDAANDVARPYLVMPKGFRATHEFWSRSGDRLFYHKKSVPAFVPAGLGWLDRATETCHEFYTDPARRLSHSAASGDGRWVVSNCVEMPGLDELVLVEVETGRAEVLRCPHQDKPQAWIYFPSFSPSGRFIVYSCDGSGESRVYLVPLR